MQNVYIGQVTIYCRLSRSSPAVLARWVGSVYLQTQHRKPALDHAERTPPPPET